jgi:hypothetical protein
MLQAGIQVHVRCTIMRLFSAAQSCDFSWVTQHTQWHCDGLWAFFHGPGKPLEAVHGSISIYSIIYGCRTSAAAEIGRPLTALATHLVAPMCAVLGIPPPPIPRLPEDPSAPRAQEIAARTKSPGNLHKVPMLRRFFPIPCKNHYGLAPQGEEQRRRAFFKKTNCREPSR